MISMMSSIFRDRFSSADYRDFTGRLDVCHEIISRLICIDWYEGHEEDGKLRDVIDVPTLIDYWCAKDFLVPSSL